MQRVSSGLERSQLSAISCRLQFFVTFYNFAISSNLCPVKHLHNLFRYIMRWYPMSLLPRRQQLRLFLSLTSIFPRLTIDVKLFLLVFSMLTYVGFSVVSIVSSACLTLLRLTHTSIHYQQPQCCAVRTRNYSLFDGNKNNY